jgi:hypothetical protein
VKRPGDERGKQSERENGAPETAGRMADAADAFAVSLDEAQRSVLYNKFETGGARRHWSYLPEPERDGLALGSLSDAQRRLAHRLIAASVSMPGYAKVVSIIAMEHAQWAVAVIYHRPPPDFATRMTPRIGRIELPDPVFAPEPDHRINDAERSVLSYVRDGPKGVFGVDGQHRSRRTALLPGARAAPAHRARQHAGRREPHPFGVAEPGQ